MDRGSVSAWLTLRPFGTFGVGEESKEKVDISHDTAVLSSSMGKEQGERCSEVEVCPSMQGAFVQGVWA